MATSFVHHVESAQLPFEKLRGHALWVSVLVPSPTIILHLLNESVIFSAELDGVDLSGCHLILDRVHLVHHLGSCREVTSHFRSDKLSDLSILQLDILLRACPLRLREGGPSADCKRQSEKSRFCIGHDYHLDSV